MGVFLVVFMAKFAMRVRRLVRLGLPRPESSPSITARFTSSSAVLVDFGVFRREFMPSFAMRLGGIKLPCRSNDIFRIVDGPCDDAKMIDVAARSISANVVDDHAFRDRANFTFPTNPMQAANFSVDKNLAVPIGFLAPQNMARARQSRTRAGRFVANDADLRELNKAIVNRIDIRLGRSSKRVDVQGPAGVLPPLAPIFYEKIRRACRYEGYFLDW